MYQDNIEEWNKKVVFEKFKLYIEPDSETYAEVNFMYNPFNGEIRKITRESFGEFTLGNFLEGRVKLKITEKGISIEEISLDESVPIEPLEKEILLKSFEIAN